MSKLIIKPMTKPMTIFSKYTVLLSFILLTACGGQTTIKPTPKVEPKPTTSSAPTPTVPELSNNKSIVPSSASNEVTPPPKDTPVIPKTGVGGYYLDDGPSENVPTNIDGIPGATPKYEQPSRQANKPYKAVGKQFTPMKQYIPYKKQGVASWYGKRFHGRKTSTGEIYDMYAMSAAHTTLPIPSYAKVTNPANGRSVIVRVNDRGPFIGSRLLDLSYAAAYQLRLIKQGHGLVEVELIDTRPEALRKNQNNNDQAKIAASSANALSANFPAEVQVKAIEPTVTTAPTVASAVVTPEPIQIAQSEVSTPIASTSPAVLMLEQQPSRIVQYYVQAGAFKNEINGNNLIKRIQDLDLAGYVGIANVYNSDLYRVKLGPYDSKQEAEGDASNIRIRLNIPTFVTNQ